MASALLSKNEPKMDFHVFFIFAETVPAMFPCRHNQSFSLDLDEYSPNFNFINFSKLAFSSFPAVSDEISMVNGDKWKYLTNGNQAQDIAAFPGEFLRN